MKSEIAWRADENGMLLGDRAHDSTLVKFLVSDAGIEFGMKRLSGDVVTVELSGVADFTVQELWKGAIVSEFWVWNVASVPETSWATPDSAWNVFFSNRVTRPDERRQEAARIARARPEAFLVQLASSYGGAVAVICDHINVFEETGEAGKTGG
jgi:hypothetical protein